MPARFTSFSFPSYLFFFFLSSHPCIFFFFFLRRIKEVLPGHFHPVKLKVSALKKCKALKKYAFHPVTHVL